MDECRNCRAQETLNLGFIGQIAPFVLKRVLGLEIGLAPSEHPLKRRLREIKILQQFFSKVYGPSVLVDLQLCKECFFVQTKTPLPEDSLRKLYADYRSDSYNQERIHYEPTYASILKHVGNYHKERENRASSLTEWLNHRLETNDDFSMLDYGGADGRFLPNLLGRKYVFEISGALPEPGVAKISDEEDLETYSYVQLAHVLEHVPFPLNLTVKAASYIKPSGFLYVEVPQELDDEEIKRLAAGDRTICIPIHEHINRYFPSSVTKLLESTGLTLIDMQREIVDFGWTQGTIIRALGRKS